MRCPYCGHPDSKVTDSRDVEDGIRRRRQCLSCDLRFTTYERIQLAALLVTKRDKRREEFNREKLLAGIRKACAKRPISSRVIEKVVEDIEAELQHLGHVEVPTTILGEMVMERLRNLDRIAYIRYASVYRDFQDIDSFAQVVQDLRESSSQLTLPQVAPALTSHRRVRPPLRHRPRNPGADGHHRNTGGESPHEQ